MSLQSGTACFLAGFVLSASGQLDARLSTESGQLQYSLEVDGKNWLSSAKFGGDGSPWVMQGSPKTTQGEGVIGSYQQTQIQWTHQQDKFPVSTTFRTYGQHNTVTMSLDFPEGMKMSGRSKNVDQALGKHGRFPLFSTASSSAFPTNMLSSLGVKLWAGVFGGTGGNIHAMKFGELDATDDVKKQEAGPVVLFEEYDGSALVIAPHNNFMTETHYVYATGLDFGPGGELEELPSGFSQEYIFVLSPGGISEAMMSWGKMARQAHSPPRPKVKDTTLETIGYWTDHGAAYWYFGYNKPSKKASIEMYPNQPQVEISEAVKAYKGLGVNLGYVQLDSWWHETETWSFHCISNYTGNPGNMFDGVHPTGKGPYFQDGVKQFSEDIGVPLSLYHAYFCPGEPKGKPNVYVKDMGFEVDKDVRAHPVPWQAEDMYSVVWQQGVDQGMIATEWDWQSVTYELSSYFRQNVTWASELMVGMSAAAEKLHVPIQYCMSYPRYLMESMKLPAVTNARGSTDSAYPSTREERAKNQYEAGTNDLNIRDAPLVTLFHYAVGLFTSKDNFVYGNPERDAPPHVSAIVALLVGGPFGPGSSNDDIQDSAGLDAIRRAISLDGTLLRSSRPLMGIDAGYALNPGKGRVMKTGFVFESAASVKLATGQNPLAGHKNATVWGPQAYTTHQVFTYNMSKGDGFTMRGGDFRPALVNSKNADVVYVAHRWTSGACVNGSKLDDGNACATLLETGDDGVPTLALQASQGEYAGDYLNVFPVIEGNAFLGEIGKWVPASETRFSDISISPSGISVLVKGAKGEVVPVTALVGSTFRVEQVTIPASGSTTVSFHA